MFMMTSQILKFVDSWKTQKSEYPEKETKIFPFSKKNYQLHLEGPYYSKK